MVTQWCQYTSMEIEITYVLFIHNFYVHVNFCSQVYSYIIYHR